LAPDEFHDAQISKEDLAMLANILMDHVWNLRIEVCFKGAGGCVSLLEIPRCKKCFNSYQLKDENLEPSDITNAQQHSTWQAPNAG
jgi:hypothetical protein